MHRFPQPFSWFAAPFREKAAERPLLVSRVVNIAVLQCNKAQPPSSWSSCPGRVAASNAATQIRDLRQTMDPGSAAHRCRAAPRPGNAPSLRGAKRRSNPERKQMLDCFAYARNDAEAHTPSPSRGTPCPGFAQIFVPRKSEGAGKAGCPMHPQRRVQKESTRDSPPQVHRKFPAFPARQGFNGCSALFLVIGLSCHHHQRFVPPT